MLPFLSFAMILPLMHSSKLEKRQSTGEFLKCPDGQFLNPQMTQCVNTRATDCEYFYAAMEYSKANEEFLKPEDCCQRFTTCDENGRITALHGDVFQPTGHLPPTIGYLTELTYFWINNHKVVSIPPEIKNLKKLKEL
jgi:hypothetical protein